MNPFWTYLLETSIGTALVWAVYYIFLRRLTFFGSNRVFLLAGIFVSLLLPLFGFELNWNISLPVQKSISQFEEEIKVLGFNPSVSGMNYSQTILYIYLAVMVSRITVFGVGTISFFQKIRNSQFQIFQHIKIFTHPDFKPASFFNKLLMPAFNPENKCDQQIFLHESEHIRLWHSWDLLVLHLCKSILWANPFIYLIEGSLREIHEYQADQKVIQQSALKDYCRLLVDNLTQGPNNLILHSFNQFQIKNRIVMMNKSKSANAEKWRYLIAMPLLVLMFGLFSWKMAEQAENVTGTWKGSDFEFTLSEGPDLKELVEGGKNLHMDGKLILDQDKTYQIFDPSGTINGQGNWSLNGKNLVMTDLEGNAVEYLIEELTDTKMVTVHQVSMVTPKGKVSGTIRLTYSKE